ncbi:MAG: hypothetical protein AAFY01_08790 [Pseudomonadota bacterium]
MSLYQFVYARSRKLAQALSGRKGMVAGVMLGVAGMAALIYLAATFTTAFWGTQAGAPIDLQPPATAENRTNDLSAMIRNGALDPLEVERAFAPHRAKLDGVNVLMVPSFLSDFLMPARNAGLTDYFSRQEEWLAEQGMGMQMAQSNTAASATQNADWIAAYIDNSPTPLCLITHSKGGVDVLTFLLSANDEQLSKVACWIALQPPLGGSPVADQVLASGDASAVSARTLHLLGGSLEAVRDLGTDRRQSVLAQHDRDIQELARRIPILSVAGRFSPDTWLDAGFPYTIPHAWLDGHGQESDGLVPVASAQLPHTPYVLIDAADHGATIRDATPLANDAGVFLKALFAVMLESHSAEQIQ